MLSLFIAEHYSVNTQAANWKLIKHRLSYKKGGKLQLRCSKCRRKENYGPKSSLANTDIFSPCPMIVSTRSKTDI